MSGAGRHVMIGEMCPQGAAGRPAVAPLVMRTGKWTDAPAELSTEIERGNVPRWSVLGADGKLAGAFDTMGLVDIAQNQSVAGGAYTGASPCTTESGAKPQGGGAAMTTRADDPRCTQAMQGCGLAIGELSRAGEPAETIAYQTVGACLAGDQLVVDIDGDGKTESFPVTGVLDGIRGPAQEWTASPTTGASCAPQFHLYDIKLAPEPEGNKPVDQKAIVMMDVLGAVDADGDGRKELVLALKFPTVRSIVVYSPVESAQRLELVGEATSFPR